MTLRPMRAQRLRLSDLDAGIFDLDGVLTRTARVHARAWKLAFDALIEARGAGQPPFDPVIDYRTHVDGKPRLDGARDFVAARGIDLAEGSPDDAPGTDSLWAVCALKNEMFRATLSRDGVERFDSSIAFVRRIREAGLRTAVVSSSRNCRAVVAAARLSDDFDTIVDGEDALRLGLAGKPQPDMFIEAARRLGVAPQRALVVEDALAGVQSARRGHFGCVIGIDRAAQAAALRAHGADLVVQDLAELIVQF